MVGAIYSIALVQRESGRVRRGSSGPSEAVAPEWDTQRKSPLHGQNGKVDATVTSTWLGNDVAVFALGRRIKTPPSPNQVFTLTTNYRFRAKKKRVHHFISALFRVDSNLPDTGRLWKNLTGKVPYYSKVDSICFVLRLYIYLWRTCYWFWNEINKV